MRPVERAAEGYEALIRQASGRKAEPFPPERVLAERWGVTQAAVNRAAQRLLAAGVLRRVGYKLMPVAAEEVKLAGAKVAMLTHRAERLAGIADEAARRGVQLVELDFIGRDAFRHGLRTVIQRRYDGLLLRLPSSHWEWDAEFAELSRLRIPYVICEECPAGHSMVTEDVRGSVRMLVEHLAGQGHRELVLFGSLRQPLISQVVRLGFEEACLRLGLADSARRVLELSAYTREVVRDGLRRLRADHPSVTGGILFDVDHLKAVLAALRMENFAVPRDLSLVSVGDSVEARVSKPTVTAASFDVRAHAHAALDLVCQHILEARKTGRAATRHRIRLEATIRARGSVATLAGANATGAVRAEGGDDLSPRTWPAERAERLREAAETLTTPHQACAGARPTDFTSLDLGPHANRALRRPHGWLGHLPLLHLDPGQRWLHGVPFHVLDERGKRGTAAVVFRSSRTTGAARRSLPEEIVIPVGRGVRAVYFLHGCGYVGEAVPFAWYDFVLAGQSRPETVPLVGRGIGALPPEDAPQPNIQDWWPDFTQVTAPGVRHAVVTEQGDPFEYERYLYTLEWENPRPGAELKEIRVRTNAASPTTLGLLAVTLLL